MNLLDVIQKIIGNINDLKNITSQFENFKNTPDEIIRAIFDTGIDYDLQASTNTIGKEQKEKIKNSINTIKQRVNLFHHEVLKIHAPENSQQGLMKTQTLEAITRVYNLLRTVEVSI